MDVVMEKDVFGFFFLLFAVPGRFFSPFVESLFFLGTTASQKYLVRAFPPLPTQNDLTFSFPFFPNSSILLRVDVWTACTASFFFPFLFPLTRYTHG